MTMQQAPKPISPGITARRGTKPSNIGLNSGAGHGNASALSGIRSKEFGGAGYNQLVFDDTDRQGRIQLSTTQAATALNLGHLIHTADNYRGSFRGLGAELRTNAYGALRAGAGYLISSYAVRYTQQQRDAAGDNTAGMAHLSQAVQLAKSFNQAAKVHQTVQYACHIGSVKAGSSAIDNETKQHAPLKALHTAASGMVSHTSLNQAQQHAADKHTTPTTDTLPHSTDAIISVSAKAGLGVTAAKHLQLANQETTTLMSGQDSQFITGNQFRLHTGQAIGMLAGAVQAGANNIGLQLIAAQDNIHLQAQSDAISIQAKDQVNIMSSHAHIDWAAAKSISLSTADGANITIEGGNITVQCPGKVMIHAGKKSFTGPERMNYKMPALPRSKLIKQENFNQWIVIANDKGEALQNRPYRAWFFDGSFIDGFTDRHGASQIMQSDAAKVGRIQILKRISSES